MRQLLFASAVVLLLSTYVESRSGTGSSADRQTQGAVEQELIALDKQFDEARRKGDTALIADLLTDDFLRVTGAATVQTKAELLKALAAQSAKPVPSVAEETPALNYTVHVHGDTAVMAHTQKADDLFPGSAVIHVFVKQQGRWKMAAWANVLGQPTTEQHINEAGYELMESGKLKEAIELFKMNVQLYPESWNTYDSLGEAYAKAGETALAIQNYEKSIQLNPKNELGKAALEKLRAK